MGKILKDHNIPLKKILFLFLSSNYWIISLFYKRYIPKKSIVNVLGPDTQTISTWLAVKWTEVPFSPLNWYRPKIIDKL